ncbi:MAG: DUF1801 domain-containing protein [Parafilimonas sp.]|nr:DUF1801 domain-containing protein [Parafilimonas sp.]
MADTKTPEIFLSEYGQEVFKNAMQLRQVLADMLPGVTEQLDISAKMVSYCYSQRYVDMVCTIIPSKKGLKLGIYKGNELPDPYHLLEGKGKISRYVNIKSAEQINSHPVKQLLKNALAAYKLRSTAAFLHHK